MSLLRFLLIGLVAGWAIGKIIRGRGFGMIGNILIGGAGALVGGYLAGFLDVKIQNTAESILMAVAGALVLFALVRLIKPTHKKRKKEEDE